MLLTADLRQDAPVFTEPVDRVVSVRGGALVVGVTRRRDQVDLCVPKTRPSHATRRYSLIRPPTRACLRTRYCSRSTGSGSGFSGAAPCRERCGRCWLWWLSYSRRIRRRWCWFHTRVRSRSLRRHPPIQRSAIAFMRGVRTLHSTVLIPAP